MMVLCDANVVIEYDEIRSELPNAPLDMEYDNNRIRNTWKYSHSS